MNALLQSLEADDIDAIAAAYLYASKGDERAALTRAVADAIRAILELELHNTTEMTQQEIAFRLGVNQGRVNEVIKRGKWLTDKPEGTKPAPRERALSRRNLLKQSRPTRKRTEDRPRHRASSRDAQLILGDL